MAYNYEKPVVTYTSAVIDATVLGTTTVATTDPTGRFVPITTVIELVAVAGYVSSPTMNTSIATWNGSTEPMSTLHDYFYAAVNDGAAGIAGITTVPPSTALTVTVDTAATATTYNVRVSITGFYH
jgi:hypothetical protein